MLSTAKKAIKRKALILREIKNVIRYGSKAPRYAERIWIRPREIRQVIFGPSKFMSCSGCVIDIKKEFKLINLYNTPRIKSCFAHWVYGIPWENTKDYMVMLEAIKSGKIWAGCKNEDDLRIRFENLDNIFKQAKQTMRLKTRNELNPKAFREEGGILVCIGENGEPLLYDGFHRLAIALILDLEIIPAQLGYVDKSAIDYIQKYRTP